MEAKSRKSFKTKNSRSAILTPAIKCMLVAVLFSTCLLNVLFINCLRKLEPENAQRDLRTMDGTPAASLGARGEDDRDFAADHIPKLRFDGAAKWKCFPDEAKDSNDGKCKAFNRSAPIYYDVVRCSKYRKLVWWFWYGKQTTCILGFGSHGNDWEHITINFIKDISGRWQQDSVTWYQHSGWYTRRNRDRNPSVFVGKNSHGSYDNRCSGWGSIWESGYCAGGCGYWDDFRNDNSKTSWIPHNIKHVSEVTDRVSGAIKNRKYFANTQLNKCKGANARLLTTSGCWRNNRTFPAPKCDI